MTSDDRDSAWFATVRVNNLQCEFKIDTAAAVTVLPENEYQVITQRPKLQSIKLYGTGVCPLKVEGKFAAELRTDSKSVMKSVYIVAGLTKNRVSGTDHRWDWGQSRPRQSASCRQHGGAHGCEWDKKVSWNGESLREVPSRPSRKDAATEKTTEQKEHVDLGRPTAKGF